METATKLDQSSPYLSYSLKETQRLQLLKVLGGYVEVFLKHWTVGHRLIGKHHIDTESSRPIRQRLGHFDRWSQEAIQIQVRQMLEMEARAESESE